VIAWAERSSFVAPLKWRSIVSPRSDVRGQDLGVKYVAALSVLAVTFAYMLGAYLYRRRTGRQKHSADEDFAGGCILGVLVTGIAFFFGAYWWFDRSFWFAVAAGLTAALLGGLLMFANWPGPTDE
jgi:hypothetical protein